MPLVPPGKTINPAKSKVRRDAEGKVTAVKFMFTDGTEATVAAEELATPDKKFDEGLEAEDTYHEMVDAFERYIKTEDGIRAIEAEKFGYNIETISEISRKKRAGTELATEEEKMYDNYTHDIMKIMAAIQNRMNALPSLNKVMRKVANVRKHVGEIFKFSSDEQERILSATWFSGDGTMILTGIPGVGKSMFIVSAMLLFCNGMNSTELNQARRQHIRFRELIEDQESFLTTATSRLMDAQKKESEARERRDTAAIEKAESELRTFKVEESNAKNALSKFKMRERAFLNECEKKMLRHSAITMMDSDKSPEEILYWTRVSMRDVKVGALAKEQEYAFTPMPRDIVLKPIKFFNEANRCNSATQNAILGLMAEHKIEYLGKTFGSPNSQAEFVNDAMEESWIWTENIAGDELPTKVEFDANVSVYCPRHNIAINKEEITPKTISEMDASERNRFLADNAMLKQLPIMTFDISSQEWICPKDANHRSAHTERGEPKASIEYVSRPNHDVPWATVYTDPGQIVWFDTNPHVPSRLDLAMIDRLDCSVIIPALKLGGKAELLALKFKKGERPVGESLTTIAVRRILTWTVPFETGITESGIEPLTYEELQIAWDACRKMVDPTSMLPAITLVSELFSAKAERYYVQGGEGAPSVFPGEAAQATTGALFEDYDVHNPVAREGIVAGTTGGRDKWGTFVDLSTFEDPVNRKARIEAGSTGSGVPMRQWPAWEITRSFGTRASESITKFAKTLAFLDACEIARPGDDWKGTELKQDQVLAVLPYVYSHRIWAMSEGGRGISDGGKMALTYPNVESFIKHEIVDNFLNVTEDTGNVKIALIDRWVDMFESVKDWMGETDNAGTRWTKEPNRVMIEALSPQHNDQTLLNPVQSAIYDFAAYEYKRKTKNMVLSFKREIMETASRENYTAAEVDELQNRIRASMLTTPIMDPLTGGDENILIDIVAKELRRPYLQFSDSTQVSRQIVGFLHYIIALSGTTQSLANQIEKWIDGTTLTSQMTESFNQTSARLFVEMETGDIVSPRTGHRFMTMLKIRFDATEKANAEIHIKVWNALKAIIDDPDAKEAKTREQMTTLNNVFSPEQIKEILDYTP